jgi:prevent-host-death family protein
VAKSYSVKTAQNDFSKLIREVESGGPVTITRRGKPVAVILSVHEYDRLAESKPTFTQAYETWKSSVDFDEIAVEPDYFEALRERSPCREIKG